MWFSVMAGGYFEAIGMRLLRGRGIDCGDLERAESIVVVNEALVRARGGQAAAALHADVHRRWARHAGVGWSERRDHELCRALQDIPACAGEPASRALRSLIFRVHLRGRGVLLLQIAHFLRLAEPLTLSSGVSATRMVHSPACGVLLAVAPASAFLIFVCAARRLVGIKERYVLGLDRFGRLRRRRVAGWRCPVPLGVLLDRRDVV